MRYLAVAFPQPQFLKFRLYGQELALCALVICPVGAYILWRGLGPVRRQIEERQALDDQARAV